MTRAQSVGPAQRAAPHAHARGPSAHDMEYDDEFSATIQELAPETLLRVFAHLDPRALARSACVCRAWHELIGRDTTWRSAFAVAFGLDDREERIAAAAGAGLADATGLRVAPALRRVDAGSWRAEYVTRSKLLRHWRRSRTTCVFSDPKILSLIHI